MYGFGNPDELYAGSGSDSMGLLDTITGSIPGVGQIYDNIYNAGQARQDRHWQEHMSNTAMVRRVTDLKNAGLNPALAYGGYGGSSGAGGPASTPGGAKASAGGGENLSQIALNLSNAASAKAMAEYKVADKDILLPKLADQASSSAKEAESRIALNEIQKEINGLILDKELPAKIAGEQIRNKLSMLEVTKLREVLPDLISMARSEAEVGRNELEKSRAWAKYYETMGVVDPFIEKVKEIFGFLPWMAAAKVLSPTPPKAGTTINNDFRGSPPALEDTFKNRMQRRR